MKHRIARHSHVGLALREAIVDDLARSASILTDVSRPRAERVHEVRRRLKRARSTLAVLKPVLGGAYRRHRGVMTGIARDLAARRDADVVAATARDLGREIGGGEPIIADAALADLGGVTAHDVLVAPIEFAALSERLARAAAEARALPAPDDAADLLATAIERAYRQGRKAMRRADTDGDGDDLHDWRKAAKHLWFLMRLSRKRLPKRAGRFAHRLERLSETLGAEHDVMLVDAHARALVTRREAEGPFRHALRKRRGALQREALTLGARLYGRKPAAFTKAFRFE